ncbi:hypothetical protein QC760_002554 [Botrytis cinerea]
MSTATEKDTASPGQRQDVESVQPVLDPDDEGSRHLEALRREDGVGKSGIYLKEPGLIYRQSTWNGLDDPENP